MKRKLINTLFVLLCILLVAHINISTARSGDIENKRNQLALEDKDSKGIAKGMFELNEGAMSSAAAVSAGGEHTCVLTSSGGLKCWGYNWYGQLGDGTTTDRHTPVDVKGMASGVTAVLAGRSHTCALTSSGGLKCWGDNYYGQLGDGTTTHRHAPVDVKGMTSGVTAISAGFNHTCALTSSGKLKCWGWNFEGQLGDGTTTDGHTPVNVKGMASGVTAVSAGGGHTCALTSSGGLKCWGDNYYGQLGDDTTTDRHTPVNVKGMASGVTAFTAGGCQTCALASSGGLKCWGDNNYGQLGDGTTTHRFTPVDVSGMTDGVADVSAKGDYTCALTSGGGLKCWGRNEYGNLGDGTTTAHSTPVDVSGITGGMTALSAGVWHTCAPTSSGGLKCWGDNYYGQLGDGTTIHRYTPVDVVEFEGKPVPQKLKLLYVPLNWKKTQKAFDLEAKTQADIFLNDIPTRKLPGSGCN